jgi:hypothetical protein
VTKTSKRFEQVKLVLEAEGIHDFALMMADETGNARVHTFGQGKSLFNGATFAIRSGKPNDLPLRPSLHRKSMITQSSQSHANALGSNVRERTSLRDR